MMAIEEMAQQVEEKAALIEQIEKLEPVVVVLPKPKFEVL